VYTISAKKIDMHCHCFKKELKKKLKLTIVNSVNIP